MYDLSKVKEEGVEGSSSFVPAKAPDNYDVKPTKIDLSEISVTPSKFEEKKPEKKQETFKYKVPEGFKPAKKVLVEKKEDL